MTSLTTSFDRIIKIFAILFCVLCYSDVHCITLIVARYILALGSFESTLFCLRVHSEMMTPSWVRAIIERTYDEGIICYKLTKGDACATTSIAVYGRSPRSTDQCRQSLCAWFGIFFHDW